MVIRTGCSEGLNGYSSLEKLPSNGRYFCDRTPKLVVAISGTCDGKRAIKGNFKSSLVVTLIKKICTTLLQQSS
jgi:hypothetical protein